MKKTSLIILLSLIGCNSGANKMIISGKIEGLKENVIVGHKIPAGTGMRKYDDIIVGPKDEYNSLLINKEEELNY